jgi:hypothetical protein
MGKAVDAFPCSATSIEAVSLGLGAGGLALLFTIWLHKKVCSSESWVLYACRAYVFKCAKRQDFSIDDGCHGVLRHFFNTSVVDIVVDRIVGAACR